MTQADFLHVLRNNVETIKRALDGDTSGHVYVWPEHWLGVKFDRDNCRAVAVDMATVVSARSKPLVFTNGHKQRAIRMEREKALIRAFVHAKTILADFESKLAA
jgi:hypothetical protein